MTRRAVQAIAAGQADQQVADRYGPGGHSVFTGLLLERLAQRGGLLTGNELGLHLQRQVGLHTRSRQTPHFGHLLGSQGGDFVFWAEETVVSLPAELQALLDSPLVGAREGAVHELARLLKATDSGMSQLARETLAHLAETDDSLSVREMVRRALGVPNADQAAAPAQTQTPRAEPAPVAPPPQVIRAPAAPPPAGVPFVRRWWRAAVLVIAAFAMYFTGSGATMVALLGAIMLIVVGITHAAKRRWARAALLGITALGAVSSLFGLLANSWALLTVFGSVATLIWAIVDAVRGEAV